MDVMYDDDIEFEITPLTEADLDDELIERLKKYGWYQNKEKNELTHNAEGR